MLRVAPGERRPLNNVTRAKSCAGAVHSTGLFVLLGVVSVCYLGPGVVFPNLDSLRE